MLEEHAKQKICPVMSSGTDGPMACLGDACMVWEEHLKLNAPDGIIGHGKYEPYDPPQGDCGMKPPEPGVCQL